MVDLAKMRTNMVNIVFSNNKESIPIEKSSEGLSTFSADQNRYWIHKFYCISLLVGLYPHMIFLNSLKYH